MEGSRSSPLAFTTYLTSQAAPRILQEKWGSLPASTPPFRPCVHKHFTKRPQGSWTHSAPLNRGSRTGQENVAEVRLHLVRGKASPAQTGELASARGHTGPAMPEGLRPPLEPARTTVQGERGAALPGSYSTSSALCWAERKETRDPAQTEPSEVPRADPEPRSPRAGPSSVTMSPNTQNSLPTSITAC